MNLMLLEIKKIEHLDRFNRRSSHELFVLKCDTCNKVWETRGSRVRITQRKTHSCSKTCKSNAHKTGGVTDVHRAKTCLDRYGVENPFASEKCKKKMRQTWKEKYGVEHARSSDVVKQKVKATMIERWGVDQAMKSPILKARQVETMQRNWGVDYPMQLQHVREAMISGSIAKYGVPYHQMNPEQAHRVLEKRTREGTLYQSKPENAFYDLLVEKYGVDDVQRQVLMNKHWSIDFHVKSTNTYVQFDGVYWHGLDRPIELISESGKNGHRRDMGIYCKWLVDRQQDRWFEERSLRFVRVTDQELKTDSAACLLKVHEAERTSTQKRDQERCP